MKNLSLIIALILSCGLHAHSQTNNNKVLEVFLNDSTFGKFVVPGFYKYCDTTLVIIDTANCFSSKEPIRFSKKILLQHQYLKKKFPINNDSLFRVKYCNLLFISVKAVNNKMFVLRYFHESSNSTGFVKYKMVKGRFKKLKYEYGQY